MPNEPAPEFTPAEVVDRALMAISGASRDRAVKTVFHFTAPQLRVEHGDLAGFDWYLSNPTRLPLIEWDDHRRGTVTVDGTEASATVFSYGPDESRLFQFRLAEQTTGKYEGCWLITAIESQNKTVPPDADEKAFVEFNGKRVGCDHGETLRDVLLNTPGMNPHNGLAGSVNCGGSGVCGTCAVEVEGRMNDRTSRESRRLSLPPHSDKEGLRLACQTVVKGDVTVRKRDGFFGSNDEQRAFSEVPVTESEYDGTYDYDSLPEAES